MFSLLRKIIFIKVKVFCYIVDNLFNNYMRKNTSRYFDIISAAILTLQLNNYKNLP